MPKNRFRDHIEIPCYCEDPFDDGPFHTYLERHGLSQHHILMIWLDTITPESLFLGLLQEWLYFGLLAVILGRPVSRSDFVRKNVSNEDVIDTTRLSNLFSNSVHDLPPLIRSHYQDHVEKVVNQVQSVVDSLSYQTPPPHRQKLLLSVVMLCTFARKQYELADSTIIKSCLMFLSLRMVNDGWCPMDVERLRADFDQASFYFISNMDPPGSSNQHARCNNEDCLEDQIDIHSYETKHVPVTCTGNCVMKSADASKMWSVLTGTSFPLILYENDQTRILESDNHPKYVAISHVWSNGLGNPRGNMLPSCQLNRISNMVNDLYEDSERPIPFWIDTLACPTEPREARALAIGRMRETYAKADKVLVLHPYLDCTAHKTLTNVECLLRIMCTSWTRRLWTLQEGMLPRSIYFQFQDGAFDFDTALEKTDGSLDLTLWMRCCLIRGLAKVPEILRDIFAPSINNMNMLLRRRTTSVVSDEAVCLACLLDLDMYKIASAPKDQKMKEFWSVQKRLHASLCLWDGPRLDIQGYRWAPAGFLNSSAALGVPGSTFQQIEAVLTESGLMFQSTAIFLRASSAVLSTRFYMRDAETQQWYVVGLHLKEKGNLTIPTEFENSDLAIIAQTPIKFIPLINYAEGCLVAIKKYEDETFHARILCPASFYPPEDRATALPGLPLEFFEDELGTLNSEYRGLISSGKVLEETEFKTQLPFIRHQTLSTMPGNLEEEQLQTLMNSLWAGDMESGSKESPSTPVTAATLPTIDYVTAIMGGGDKATVCYKDGDKFCFDGVSVSNHENIPCID